MHGDCAWSLWCWFYRLYFIRNYQFWWLVCRLMTLRQCCDWFPYYKALAAAVWQSGPEADWPHPCGASLLCVSARLLASTPVCFFCFYGHLLQQLLVKRFTLHLLFQPFSFVSHTQYFSCSLHCLITPPFPTWSLSTPLKTNSFDGESPWRILNFFFYCFYVFILVCFWMWNSLSDVICAIRMSQNEYSYHIKSSMSPLLFSPLLPFLFHIPPLTVTCKKTKWWRNLSQWTHTNFA